MRIFAIVVCALAAGTQLAAAQPPRVDPAPGSEPPLSLLGCAPFNAVAQYYILPAAVPQISPKTATLRTRLGRVHVVGQLIPTTNIAAQQGYLDATVGAMAINDAEQDHVVTAPRRASLRRITAALPPRGGCPSP